MNITLSIDEKTLAKARKIAASMGKSLNQLIREALERVTEQHLRQRDWEEFEALSGKGDTHGWKFDRDELHERTQFPGPGYQHPDLHRRR